MFWEQNFAPVAKKDKITGNVNIDNYRYNKYLQIFTLYLLFVTVIKVKIRCMRYVTNMRNKL